MIYLLQKKSKYGIELLDANNQLGMDKQGKLTIVNEALGKFTEMKLLL